MIKRKKTNTKNKVKTTKKSKKPQGLQKLIRQFLSKGICKTSSAKKLKHKKAATSKLVKKKAVAKKTLRKVTGKLRVKKVAKTNKKLVKRRSRAYAKRRVAKTA